MSSHRTFRIWSGRWESNPRPKLGKDAGEPGCFRPQLDGRTRASKRISSRATKGTHNDCGQEQLELLWPSLNTPSHHRRPSEVGSVLIRKICHRPRPARALRPCGLRPLRPQSRGILVGPSPEDYSRSCALIVSPKVHLKYTGHHRPWRRLRKAFVYCERPET
jgi:hypothetical protein